MKRTPLKRQSDKRRKQNQRYRRLATKFLADHPFCAVCDIRRSTQVHHINGRNGDRLLEDASWLAICNKCHQKIHENGEWARDLGLLM